MRIAGIVMLTVGLFAIATNVLLTLWGMSLPVLALAVWAAVALTGLALLLQKDSCGVLGWTLYAWIAGFTLFYLSRILQFVTLR